MTRNSSRRRFWMSIALVAAGVVTMAAMPFGAVAADTGSIGGTVLVNGSPIADVPVVVERVGEQPHSGFASTDSAGSYVATGLPDGDYAVQFCAPDCGPNLDPVAPPLGEWYDNAFDRVDATLVSVVDGAAVTNIDANLTFGGSISGKVGGTYRGLPGAIVDLYRADGTPMYGGATTDEDGEYTFSRLAPGTYFVHYPEGGLWYDGASSFAEATPVVVPEGVAVTDIDFVLPSLDVGTISGGMFDYGGGGILESGVAEIYDTDFNLVDRQLTATGRYQSRPLPTGDYYVFMYNGEDESFIDYFGEWYSGAPLLRPDQAQVVSVRGMDVFNVSATLDPLFWDMFDTVFTNDIGFLRNSGITKGCNPPINDRFCTDDLVTRGQMAAFLVRALGLTAGAGSDLFTDDNDSIFEDDIDRLATAGITKGCNPPTNDRYCPDGHVTRGQMAAFLNRAVADRFPVLPAPLHSETRGNMNGHAPIEPTFGTDN